ncbi:hypothetical protein Barb4_00920 [Bacteroidales bacterium Barb4]|nr:hypothetical protein Barb4_00920 [Bacteroidales bacterium Barb4]
MQRTGNRRNISDEVKKCRREYYSKFFSDLAKVVFTVLVVGNVFSVFAETENRNFYLILEVGGLLGTFLLVSIGNKFIK